MAATSAHRTRLQSVALGFAILALSCGEPAPPDSPDEATATECSFDGDCPGGICFEGICHIDACLSDAECERTEVCDLTTCPSACRSPAVDGEMCAWFADYPALCRRNRGTHTCGIGLLCPELQPGLGDEVECQPGAR